MEIEYSLPQKAKAVLVSVISDSMAHHHNTEESTRSLLELQELLRTLGHEYTESFIQKRKKIDSSTIVGKGKLFEIAQFCEAKDIDLLVFDIELTASQIRNISKITKIPVIDRCQVILQIFANHAQTKEAKIQIEISRLQYLLPRLTSLWTHFSKQKGGIGMKGEGEQQLELDKRIIRRKIDSYKKQLKEIKVSRDERKKKRSSQSLTAALVGYTNVGKSSLMNNLCQENILSENKLFATLDSTYRTLTPDTKPPMLLIDTVGFLSNLPNTLIEGFKTTLESIEEADLLIIVSDLSDPYLEKHLQTTNEVLEELKFKGKDRFYVFNKKDQVENLLSAKVKISKYPNSIIVSSFDKKDMSQLRKSIIDYFLKKQPDLDLFVPYDRGEIHSSIQRFTNVLQSRPLEKGIFYRVKSPKTILNKIGVKPYQLSQNELDTLLNEGENYE